MAKTKARYVCNECGGISNKWAGQCADCGAWNSLSEAPQVAASPTSRNSNWAGQDQLEQILTLDQIPLSELPRETSGIEELDRVLGGGLVNGSVVLLGGDPGIGKSTLLLQALCLFSQKHPALYVTGEESLQQVRMRASRLGVDHQPLKLFSSTAVEDIIHNAEKLSLKVMVIDSIQTIFSQHIQSAPGSVSQIRECTAMLVRFAKQSQTSIFLVGHVTKEGQLAGPRVLEHMVDTVLYFEGDAATRFRVIRAVKNRFGAMNELGIFAMTETGLKAVSNPSAIFISHHERPVSGSIIMVSREGSRPFLVEVQALVTDSHLGNPRRISVGIEANRLAMLLAVLQRHGGIPLSDQDVFVNAVGGVRISETGADLAVVLAILSSFRDRPIDNHTLVFGELGLSGEVRPVPNGEERLREAYKHGFNRAVVPQSNVPRKGIDGMEIIGVNHLADTLDAL